MATISMAAMSNTSTTASMITTTTELPVLGLPGNNFYILHIAALVSLVISIVSSVAVFAILRPRLPAFWSRPMGERFAVYLALSDLLSSVSHTFDHSYMLAVHGHPPEDACVVMGYFVATCVIVQALMVTFMSLNAFILVVKETKISLGKYDWRFLTGTLLCPFLIMIPCAVFRWLGPSGGWCVYDMRKEMGKMLALALSLTNVVTVVVNVFCYAFIFIKIRTVTTATQAMGSSTSKTNQNKTVQVMMKFVAAYIFQWWTHAVYAIWSLLFFVPFSFVMTMVVLINMGGFYNLVVYTLLRRMGMMKDSGNKEPAKTKSPSQSQTTSMTNINE